MRGGRRECVGEGGSELEKHVGDTVVGGSNKWDGDGTVSWWDVGDSGSVGVGSQGKMVETK